MPLPLQDVKLRFGDTLLVHGTWESIDLVRQEARNFVVLGGPEELDVEPALTPVGLF